LRKRILFLPAVVALAIFASGCTLLLTFTEIGNTFYFAGEIKNNTGVDVSGDNVRRQFLNSSNQTIGAEGTVDACKRAWPAGSTNYFEASTTDDDVKKVIAKLKLDSSFDINEPSTANLSFSNISILRDGDELTVTGTVKNNDNDEIVDVRVCIVVRNDDDDIVRVLVEDLSPADLDEDEDGDFSFTDVAVLDDDNDTATVDIYADGIIDGDPSEAEEDLNNTIVEGTATPTATSTPVPTATPAGP
jgi:hypothetical protein